MEAPGNLETARKQAGVGKIITTGAESETQRNQEYAERYIDIELTNPSGKKARGIEEKNIKKQENGEPSQSRISRTRSRMTQKYLKTGLMAQ